MAFENDENPNNDIPDDLKPLGFCIGGNFTPPCKILNFEELPDEKDTIVLLLAYFKEFLPQVLARKTDYYNQPIIIDPKDIDVIAQKDYGKYVAVLMITDDNSTYPDSNFYREETNYAFQLDLQVSEDDLTGSYENLIKFKSAVKTLLINMDNNLNLITEIDGFSFGQYGIDQANKYVRQGTYRFSIQADNYKQ